MEKRARETQSVAPQHCIMKSMLDFQFQKVLEVGRFPISPTTIMQHADWWLAPLSYSKKVLGSTPTAFLYVLYVGFFQFPLG